MSVWRWRTAWKAGGVEACCGRRAPRVQGAAWTPPGSSG
ncbi:hypothetical protein AB0I28_24005 [Phytomonospora sp. NPDC050363]